MAPPGTIADFELDPGFPLLHEFESPTDGENAAYPLDLKGWVLIPPAAVLESIRVEHGGRVELQRLARPDIEVAVGGPQAIGYHQLVPIGDARPGAPWELVVAFDGVEYRTTIPHVPVVPNARAKRLAEKRSKFADREPSERGPADFELDFDFPFPHEFESPTGDEAAATYAVGLKGWVLIPPAAVLESFRVEHGGRVDLQQRARPDIELEFGEPQAIGYHQLVPVGDAEAGVPWELVIAFNGVEYRTAIPHVHIVANAHAQMLETKRAKLPRIEPLLRCPAPVVGQAGACGGTFERQGGELACVRCGTRYPASGRSFDMLSAELRMLAAVSSTENVSEWDYDPTAQSIIDSCRGGLVLDAGSGMKNHYRDNVVYFEIADYESTDVLGVGESLPFADDTFDGVLSLAVLEHVRDPFRCAAEIVRVLRPGGRLYAAVPFLQPYHGYPNHYYNMSLQGLENVFADLAIEEKGQQPYGWPIWTLCWFLSRYVEGLPAEVAKRFSEMRIGDFLKTGGDLIDEDFVYSLDADAIHDLASVNYILATKPN